MSNQGINTAATGRTETNRQCRIAKALRAAARKAARPPKVARGTARAIRRRSNQIAWTLKHRLAA